MNLEEEGDVGGVDEVLARTFAEALDTSYIGAYNADRMGTEKELMRFWYESRQTYVVCGPTRHWWHRRLHLWLHLRRWGGHAGRLTVVGMMPKSWT